MNHLMNETSPYLLQHADNPVDWYPWGAEAFDKARREDKPVFLSVGYSTCHWCHVMAHESFEDMDIAGLLNSGFVSVKVDREERPDVDSVYMEVCQAMTGSGGWPMSIFLTADREPFFAGTYFPKKARYGTVGFYELLLAIRDAWQSDRKRLLSSAQSIIKRASETVPVAASPDEALLSRALEQYKAGFDEKFGGFGHAPKFPSAHNILFLLQQYQKRGDKDALRMAEQTLTQMARGGLFDHIGYGFCRYSTDRRFLVPHFEKMLYDNALLILAYCRAFELTHDAFYLDVAEKTADYELREMRHSSGAFFSAQDADSSGEEGKYYVLTPDEVISVLGEEEGSAFCRRYGITAAGNFEGKSIPNLLGSDEPFGQAEASVMKLRAYLKKREVLHTDDKILTVWNSLMIAALCSLYRATANASYLESAQRAQQFIEEKLTDKDTLYVSYRSGSRKTKGFLDDYAAYCFALLALYDVTLESGYLSRAGQLSAKAASDFFDTGSGGFTLSGKENEALIFSIKESYDGAMPSGNGLMSYVLVRLRALWPDAVPDELLDKQLAFLSGESASLPSGHAMFLIALSDLLDPPETVTVVRNGTDELAGLVFCAAPGAVVRVLEPSDEYRLLDGQTAVYVCRDSRCLPPISMREYIAGRSPHA